MPYVSAISETGWRNADRVGDLDLAAVGEARGDHVLGHVAGRVGGGAVDLRRVLAGECAAAVARGAAVGVDDDLAAGEPGVANRPADDELAGRVDEEVREQLSLGEELLVLGVEDRLEDVLPEIVADHLLARLLAMLGRDQDLLDLDRAIVLVTDRDLSLAVRAEVADDARLANLGELPRELVRQLDRHRHQRLRLAGRVPEHHSLVSGAGAVELVGRLALALLEPGIHPLSDVGRLLVDRREDGARLVVEAVAGVVVADLADRLARDLRDVDVGLRGDLTGHDHEAGVDQALAGDAPGGVVPHHRVEDAVGDLVADLVRVPLGDRLGGEQVLVFGKSLHDRRATVADEPPSRC